MPERASRVYLTPEDCWALQDSLIGIISEEEKERLRINQSELLENIYNVVSIIATNAARKEAAYLQNSKKVMKILLPIHPRMWDGKDRWRNGRD